MPQSHILKATDNTIASVISLPGIRGALRGNTECLVNDISRPEYSGASGATDLI